ncbi:c6 transcription factor [Ophiostoma piceae UAMH 11346]|uniref:C6 transcription factor n=1 Tax=Ophiostoma piceae (strain UAMH 11346) TaxID=1262450 RepID=S3CA93_OPHP1|nr:c6 transcription factor [Ophiostoma piceae UAMH 11346]
MSALTFSHLSSDTFEKESQKKAGRKRPRIREAVSCWQCRSRKIRCDREQPCQPCVERDAGAKCTYSQTKASASVKSNTATFRAAEKSPLSPTVKPSTPSSSSTARSGSVASNGPANADACPATSARNPSITQSSARGSVSSRPSGSVSSASIPRSHVFQGSDRKTRLVSASHWMAPCNEMKVIKAMLTGSKEFQSSLQEFAGVKETLRRENIVTINIPTNATAAGGRLSPSILLEGLPDKTSCEEWIGRYFKGYGRVYDIVDPATLAADIDEAFSCLSGARFENATAINSVFLLRILITVALGMQLSLPYRLHGRQLGRLVEDYIHRASHVQKPCIGSVQVLLQLVLLKTIMSADTDAEHDIMGILGLTSHVVLSMGLHRDPALFEKVPPYYAEKRKRLWACFFRLHLAYCIRTGTQFPIRLEDSDCPLPTPSILQSPFTETLLGSESIRSSANSWSLGEKEAQNDAYFGHASAELANIMAPVHQTLCSTKPRITTEQQETLQAGFSALMAALPPSLQSGTAITDSIIELQRTMLSTSMHSFLLIVSLSHLFAGPGQASASTAPDVATAEAISTQRSQLLEIWDCTISILNQFLNICQEDESTGKSASKSKFSPKPSTVLKPSVADSSVIAHHFLWTDVGRASLSACLVVGRLRRQEVDRAVPFSVRPQQHHTAAIFQQMLSQSLDVLLQLWRSKYHMGPVTAKTSLLLTVTAAVTANLYTNFDDVLNSGVGAANQLISDIKEEVAQRQASAIVSSSGIYNMGDTVRTTQSSSSRARLYSTPAHALPLAVSDVSNPPGLASSGDIIPQTSSFSWAPIGIFDTSVPQIPDLSTGSSTASHAASPDYGVGGGSNLFGMDFAASMSFPFSGAPGSYAAAQCPFTGDADNTFMEFSGDTIMNMF